MKDLRAYAHQLVSIKTGHGKPNQLRYKSDNEPEKIESIGTERSFKSCIHEYLEWRMHANLPVYGPHCISEMDEYLIDQSEVLSQKALDQHRQSLRKVFRVELKRYVSLRTSTRTSKNYTKNQIERIISELSPRATLSTLLCLDAGLRASELLSLRTIDHQPVSKGRTWREDLYSQRGECVFFSVHGKGGLVRKIAVSEPLANELEKYRLDIPKITRDREVNRTSDFDLVGGQSFSQLFSSACKKALGNSDGAHGLRHCWAKNRFAQLLSAKIPRKDSLKIVSEESGHFRPEITFVYLS